MAQTMRFGRRLAIPSTRQIRHELLVFAAQEDARLKEIERKRADPTADPLVAVPVPEAPAG